MQKLKQQFLTFIIALLIFIPANADITKVDYIATSQYKYFSDDFLEVLSKAGASVDDFNPLFKNGAYSLNKQGDLISGDDVELLSTGEIVLAGSVNAKADLLVKTLKDVKSEAILKV